MNKGKILIADDELNLVDILEKMLMREGYEVFKSSNGEEVLEIVDDLMPDLILLDINMPVKNGFEVKTKLNEKTSTASIPVIFLTGRGDLSDRVEGLNLGVDDYITKPFQLEELRARVLSVLKRRKFYEEISMTDGLTGLRNVNFFNEQIGIFFSLAKRYNRLFSLAVIDVNDFKKINDTHGHSGGDFALRKLSEVMKETFRKSDIITRYGGDEFIVILPEVDQNQAERALKRVKDKVNGKEFLMEDTEKRISFSISAGTASFNEKFENETQLFDEADANMYKDKENK